MSLLVLALGAACEDTSTLSPMAPSPAGLVDPQLAEDVGLKWSPYIGVHIDGRAIDAYRDALSALRRTGRVSGLRVEINKSNQTSDAVPELLEEPAVRAARAMRGLVT